MKLPDPLPPPPWKDGEFSILATIKFLKYNLFYAVCDSVIWLHSSTERVLNISIITKIVLSIHSSNKASKFIIDIIIIIYF
jgi:hypothetical protein